MLGIRTGYEDQEGRARLERKPALLDESAGVWYDEFSNLRDSLKLSTGKDADPVGFALPADSTGTLWADGLQIVDEETKVLAQYQHPHFGRWPALTTRAHGSGRITYVGTVPDQKLAAAIMDWAVQVGNGAPSWRPDTDSQTISSSTNAAGERIHVVHNWSWEPSCFSLPAAARDAVSEVELASGTALELGAWDVRVVIEQA